MLATLPKFIAGEVARQHWKKPLIQTEMHITKFNELTGGNFIKRANVLLDDSTKRADGLKYTPITGQESIWNKKSTEHIYALVYNDHIMKVGGTRDGLKGRWGSYSTGRCVPQRVKKTGENYPGKMSVTNAYLYHTIEDDLLKCEGRWEIYSHELPPQYHEVMVYGTMTNIKVQTYHGWESQCIEMYKNEIGHIPCLCANSDPNYKQKNTKGDVTLI